MICTQVYNLDRFNFVDVPERFQDEWHTLCFGFAKKCYSRFAEMERLVSISAESCGGIRLEPSNDDAFVDSDSVTWQRLAYCVIFGSDVRDALTAIAAGNDWVYTLCETSGDGLNLYSGSKVASVLLNDNGETVLTFVPKLSRVENTVRVYKIEGENE